MPLVLPDTIWHHYFQRRNTQNPSLPTFLISYPCMSQLELLRDLLGFLR
uniref:Uncharacterized protein n=1 Tax=Anguilla anguilla TaxID=7936 RepID=A0A0E9SCJ8_ANGAN